MLCHIRTFACHRYAYLELRTLATLRLEIDKALSHVIECSRSTITFVIASTRLIVFHTHSFNPAHIVMSEHKLANDNLVGSTYDVHRILV